MKEINVITHAGLFHADEVLCTAMLKKIYHVNVRRVFQVPEEIDENTIVYDIGGGQFDHHTEENKRNNGFHEGTQIPYASCGLVWDHFYKEILLAKGCAEDAVEDAKEKVDQDLILGIDAADNGVFSMEGSALTVSGIVRLANPAWNDNVSTDEAFHKAVDLAGEILELVLHQAIAQAAAKKIVEKAIDDARDGIMVFDRYTSWHTAFFLSANPKTAKIDFLIYPSLRGGYNVQAVPVSLTDRTSRLPFPEAWRGKTPEELQAMTSIAGLTFCHNSGFLCACKTLDDAYQIVSLTRKVTA
ncbi:MAG: MYG1 family protein [Solobacterium sp.]|nr:MYG1 family protein [Solobacterium sp.]